MDLLTEYRLKYSRRLASLNLDICASYTTTTTDISCFLTYTTWKKGTLNVFFVLFNRLNPS